MAAPSVRLSPSNILATQQSVLGWDNLFYGMLDVWLVSISVILRGVSKQSTTIATKIGERLFVDTSGPYPETESGNKYWVCLFDDKTRTYVVNQLPELASTKYQNREQMQNLLDLYMILYKYRYVPLTYMSIIFLRIFFHRKYKYS